MGLYAVKTIKSSEETVANMIIERSYDEIHAAIAPDQMSSYIIVESEDIGVVKRAIEDVPNATKVVPGETSMSEVEQFLQPTSDVASIQEGAVVRITEGPFQGEKANVSEVDAKNERVTVELYDATVPIPVEIRGDQMRVLDQEEV